MEDVPQGAPQDDLEGTSLVFVPSSSALMLEDLMEDDDLPPVHRQEVSSSVDQTTASSSSFPHGSLATPLSPTTLENAALASLVDSATPRNHLFLSTLAETTVSRSLQHPPRSSSSHLTQCTTASRVEDITGGGGGEGEPSNSQPRRMSSTGSDAGIQRAGGEEEEDEEVTDNNEPVDVEESATKGKGKGREIVSNSGSKFSHREAPPIQIAVAGAVEVESKVV